MVTITNNRTNATGAFVIYWTGDNVERGEREGILLQMRKYYIMILCGLFISLQVVLGRFIAIDVVFMRVSFIFVPIALGGALFGPLWNGLLCVAADIAGYVLAPNQGPFFPGFTLSAFLSGFAYGFFLTFRLPSAWSWRGIFLPPGDEDGDGDGDNVSNGDGDSNGDSVSNGDGDKPRLPVVAENSYALSQSPLSTTRSLIIRTALAAFCVTLLIDALLNTCWVAILYERAYTFYLGTRMIKSLAMLPVHVVVFGALWRSLGKYIEFMVIPKININHYPNIAIAREGGNAARKKQPLRINQNSKK